MATTVPGDDVIEPHYSVECILAMKARIHALSATDSHQPRPDAFERRLLILLQYGRRPLAYSVELGEVLGLHGSGEDPRKSFACRSDFHAAWQAVRDFIVASNLKPPR